ncbi:hypothetical protein N7536_012222 [Penicillium majusculum]|nr:hypothetical protein N7536_012222 [Penicillium majusculum]
MCALTFVIVGLIVFNVKRRERQISVKQAIEIATDPNLAAQVDAFWQSTTNTTKPRPNLLFAQAQWAERFDARQHYLVFSCRPQGQPLRKITCTANWIHAGPMLQVQFMTTRKQYFLRQSQDQCFVYATGAAANLSDKNDLGCWATFTHCLFMRKAQLVLDFFMFLSRSSFPQLNKDGASVSPASLEETL